MYDKHKVFEKILVLFDTLKESLKEEKDTAKPPQQELLSQLSRLEELISELVDIAKRNLNKTKLDLEKQARYLSNLQKRVKELEGSDQKLLSQLAFEWDRALLDKVLKDSKCENAEDM